MIIAIYTKNPFPLDLESSNEVINIKCNSFREAISVLKKRIKTDPLNAWNIQIYDTETKKYHRVLGA
jgi:hypothetical protein